MNRFPIHRDLHYDYHSSHPNLQDMSGINMGRLYNSHEYLPHDYRRYNHYYHHRETPPCSSPEWIHFFFCHVVPLYAYFPFLLMVPFRRHPNKNQRSKTKNKFFHVTSGGGCRGRSRYSESKERWPKGGGELLSDQFFANVDVYWSIDITMFPHVLILCVCIVSCIVIL